MHYDLIDEDTCGWCAFADDCVVKGDYFLHCIPKDIFVDGNTPACTTFVDEEEGSIGDGVFNL